MARSRADEALARRDELARLFDLSRDILLTTDSREAIDELARHMARRFGLDYVGICLPDTGGWRVHGSSDTVTLDRSELDRALAVGARRPRVRRAHAELRRAPDLDAAGGVSS